MMKSALVLAVLAVGVPAAAQDDAIVKLYGDVLHELHKRPADTTALLALQPPTDPKNAAQRAALDRIIHFLQQEARKHPDDFQRAYNAYLALRNRYSFYGALGDASAAILQLKGAAKAAPERSVARARCAYEYARLLLDLKTEHAAKLAGGNVRRAAIQQFLKAKTLAKGRPPYAPRSALALGELHIDAGNLDKAKTFFREALRLDKDRGYVTNRAYDRLGLMRVSAGDFDGALAMLEAAGRVQLDADLRTRGFAWSLARALVESGRLEKPVQYLEQSYQRIRKHGGSPGPDLLYSLALGYTELKQRGPALLYWDRYFAVTDPNEEQRTRAKKKAAELAASMPASITY
jgi:tetratricopeptide (TPR) repeat protein